ncbi:hypothetical protein O181_007475 [Austropuccinia psidii MF-1]|uniref:Tf2-1-like SH3-like domain-containing protein n=1 Tax=Austropuccinia psidii MF-1 TaxID=1389203 RepID=A0A9Q3BN07_9BASI|nr:hypothetical protein [Austropuccinia psidii MF-1]
MEEISVLTQFKFLKTHLLERYQRTTISTEHSRRTITVNNKAFKKYAERDRTIPPDFQPGENVWLSSKDINTMRPTKKLSERWLGPFEVLKKISSHAYHLKFPQQTKKVHPVFHVSLNEPVKKSNITNQHKLPSPPVIVEE